VQRERVDARLFYIRDLSMGRFGVHGVLEPVSTHGPTEDCALYLLLMKRPSSELTGSRDPYFLFAITVRNFLD
jgi:hypothetical protein